MLSSPMVAFAFRIAGLLGGKAPQASRGRRHRAAARAYGGALEIAQLFVPGRGPGMMDWGADALGAWLGVGAIWMLRRPVLAALR